MFAAICPPPDVHTVYDIYNESFVAWTAVADDSSDVQVNLLSELEILY